MQEIWQSIKGFEDYYEVSNMGNVRSKDRVIIQNNGVFHTRKSKVLKPQINKKNGYFQVMLVIHKRCRLFYIHRLVAEAFVENPYNLELVSHINNDDTDNRAENLIYMSRSIKKNKELKLY
ncbi:NUMOD4 domain-containing protein [Prevotella koreensis]